MTQQPRGITSPTKGRGATTQGIYETLRIHLGASGETGRQQMTISDRPVGLKLLTLTLFIFGILYIYPAILYLNGYSQYTREYTMYNYWSPIEFYVFPAISLIILSISLFFIGASVYDLEKWAWFGAFIISGLIVLFNISNAIKMDFESIIQCIVFSLIVIYLLAISNLFFVSIIEDDIVKTKDEIIEEMINN